MKSDQSPDPLKTSASPWISELTSATGLIGLSIQTVVSIQDGFPLRRYFM